MPVVILGKLVLNWCPNCNIPILSIKTCSICGSKTIVVKHTPPGDIRPAFDFEIDLIKTLIDNQFGPSCGDRFIPKNSVVILNHAPDIDRLDEVIFNGAVQGAIKFDLIKNKLKFLPRLSGALRFVDAIKKGYIKMDFGAVKPIMNGSNALAPGIIYTSPGIKLGDEVLIFDQNNKLLGVGAAHMTSQQMNESNHGLAVKIRWHIKEENNIAKKETKTFDTELVKAVIENKEDLKNEKDLPIHKTPYWKLTIKANKPHLDQLVEEAKYFIKKLKERHNLPVLVSYSGGKDSLVTLLLVMDAGIKPSIFFIDTGLEFQETIENINNIAKMYELKLIISKPINSFWSSFEYFGPPGKDYRWCCKTCKLGPTTRLIKESFPKGVLVFIGQRRYESEQRSSKNQIWHNPWVPGQIGASPIQNWSALHVWLFLFTKNAPYNILYEQGLERIGCWLCPASDMADLMSVSCRHPDYDKWMKKLDEYSKKKSYTSDWIKYGFWRWKKFPEGIKNLIKENNIKIKSQIMEIEERDGGLKLLLADGFMDCKYGISLEGVYNKSLDMKRIMNLLNILGEPSYDEVAGYCTIKGKIDIYPDGGIVVKGKNAKDIKTQTSKVHKVILRAMECIGCGICLGRCDNNALKLDDSIPAAEKIVVITEKCSHCGSCLGPCPVINFNITKSFEL